MRAACACTLLSLTFTADADLVGRLAATPGGTNYQAYYDTELDITWTANANANINGTATWKDQVTWVAGLDINGVTGWRLPSMDVNGDDAIAKCTTDQAACKDNELGHLFNYGAGTVFGSGITFNSPSPFSNIQSDRYWTTTEGTYDNSDRWVLLMNNGKQEARGTSNLEHAWAVKSGDVRTMPVPAAVWLFGSGLLGMIGAARRKSPA